MYWAGLIIDKSVSIIILNWNGWEDTIECLESLYQINYNNYDVILIDNDSQDDSIQKLKEYAKGELEVNSRFISEKTENKPIQFLENTRRESETSYSSKNLAKIPSNKKLTIIKNDVNEGFPGGCNLGMEYALNKNTDYILLLNNDVVVNKNFLNELVNFSETDSTIGIVGSKIYSYNEPNILQAAGGKIGWYSGNIVTYGFQEVDKGQYDKIAERDYVWGTSFLLKQEVLNKISFMDTTFFFGVEEYDYCTRAKKAGFKIFYVPKSKIWHKQGASSKKLIEYPETLEIIRKTGGLNYYKYYYKLFQKHGPPILFIIPFIMYMKRITSFRILFKFILKRTRIRL